MTSGCSRTGGRPWPIQVMTPPSIRIDPFSSSVPASSMVTTTRQHSLRITSCPAFDKRLLDRMQALAGGYAFDGADLAFVRLGRQHQATADEGAIEPDRAGPTLALLARVLRTVESQPLT